VKTKNSGLSYANGLLLLSGTRKIARAGPRNKSAAGRERNPPKGQLDHKMKNHQTGNTSCPENGCDGEKRKL
jgi:hypothetical protein